jgi:hypothetical protein
MAVKAIRFFMPVRNIKKIRAARSRTEESS